MRYYILFRSLTQTCETRYLWWLHGYGVALVIISPEPSTMLQLLAQVKRLRVKLPETHILVLSEGAHLRRLNGELSIMGLFFYISCPIQTVRIMFCEA